MIALNAIVTDQLNRFKKDVDKLIAKNTKKDEAIFQVIKRYISESKKIRFEGNNYSEDWEKEAEKRGLSNIRATPAALRGLISKDAVRIFTEQEILSERELKARYEIQMENYSKKVQIESRVVGDLAKNHIIPIAIRYQNTLIENVRGLKDVLDSKTFVKLSRNQMQTIKEISEHVEGIKDKVAEMLEERKKANRIEDLEDQALAYNLKVFPYLAEIREHVDKLELMVDDELWPLPKYREMLFIK
jgi:glutamine synthetase